MKETKEILLWKITLPKFYKDWVVLPFEKVVIDNKYLPIIKKLTEKDLKPSGEYPVIGQGENEIEGYSNDLSAIIKDFLPIIIFGDHTRRFKFVKKPVAIFADGVKIIKPYEVVNALFFYYFLKSIEIENQGYSRHNKFLSVISVPIPPLSEQNAISEKLDIIFSHLETSRKKLAKIPKYIAKFRQAVLQRAVSGELTADWREKNNLNFNFTNVILKDVCHLITKGTTPDTFVADGIPFFKMYNMVNGKIDFEYKPQYISAEIHNTTLKRSIIYPNDVLLNIVGPPLGKVAIVPSLFLEANINQAIALFRTKEIILPQYLYYFLLEGEPIRNITFETKGDAGQSNISLQQCRLFQINLPQKEEQIEIVRQVELLFAIADKAQKQYETAMEYFQKLEKSVLLQAFSGELVEPQTQTESLEDLLERIKIERERLEKEKKVLRKDQAIFKQNIKNMEKKSIEEMLKEAPLSVEEIWQASVYFENKEVEKFYEELCKLSDDKKIVKNFSDDKKITTILTLQEYAN